MEEQEILTTNRKALLINMDAAKYGTLAEIGAGQEVARHFFTVGGAAGTVAKSMSAYDMKFSDEIYGKSQRYVSHERLHKMLKHEYELLIERLSETKGQDSTFFTFADTVSARNYSGTNQCHGWLGVRFQVEPGSEPHDIDIHIRMWDKTNQLQQEALGIIGVNLIYGAFFLSDDTDAFIKSLGDNLGTSRIEVDMLQFSGEKFTNVDNRIMSLKLVEQGFTNAVLYNQDGEIQQPANALYKKSIILERGSFRPVTNVNIDMLKQCQIQFLRDEGVENANTEVLFEMTMRNLKGENSIIDYEDFLARIDVITSLGHNVLVSNYFEFFNLSEYFRRYTQKPIGIVLGINNLIEIFDEEYYDNLDGGILEALGRLFKSNIKMYIYPMSKHSVTHYKEIEQNKMIHQMESQKTETEDLITAETLVVKTHLQNLYEYLLHNHFIVPIHNCDKSLFNIFSRDILKKISEGDDSWEDAVPAEVASIIKVRKLWNYPGE